MRMQGTTPAALADRLEVSRMSVSNVIHGRVTSKRIASAIAEVIKKPVGSIWPGRYEPKKSGMRRTRTRQQKAAA